MISPADLQETAAVPTSSDGPIDLPVVITLTERVEAAISAGEWQEAAELEAQRRAALGALIERNGGPAGIAGELRDALVGVVSRTHRMIGEAHHHRRSLLREASMVRLGRKAADEYERNST